MRPLLDAVTLTQIHLGQPGNSPRVVLTGNRPNGATLQAVIEVDSDAHAVALFHALRATQTGRTPRLKVYGLPEEPR